MNVPPLNVRDLIFPLVVTSLLHTVDQQAGLLNNLQWKNRYSKYLKCERL